MTPVDWYLEYTKQIQELRRLFWKCVTLIESKANSETISTLRDIIVIQCNNLERHWKFTFPDEALPKSSDIFRHLRYAQVHDFHDLIFNDFLDADHKAFGYFSTHLKSHQKQRIENYVSEERIKEISHISNNRFDLKRLIQICNELNLGYQTGQIYALPLLVRSILDHIPPIFDCKTFKKVANNYPTGTKSFRDSAKQLEDSSRKIGDSFLHTQIRQSESLPNSVQVDFRHSLDVVLSEIVRIL